MIILDILLLNYNFSMKKKNLTYTFKLLFDIIKRNKILALMI